jgi:hypothetical protein
MRISTKPNYKIRSSKLKESSDLMQAIPIAARQRLGPTNTSTKPNSNATYYVVYESFCWGHHTIYIFRGVD